MASPMTTIEVVGATASGFGSAFFGDGARELSTGACCSELSNCRWPPPKNPPKKPPPLGRCGRCRLRNGKRSSPKSCACAGELTASSRAARPATSTAARRAAPTSQRESRFFPVMRGAKPMGPYCRNGPHGPLAPEKCQLKDGRAASLTRAQLVQDAGGGKTVRNPAASGLKFANCSTGLKPKLTIRLADIETVPRKQLLKFQPFRPRQNTLISWPVLYERATAAQAVRQVPDRQGVSFSGVVFHDDAEVREHQEAGPLHAGG